MPTTIIRYVDPNADASGDGTTNALTGANCAYQSLSIWEAARQRDLVAADEIERVICSSRDGLSAPHAADTTAVTIDGWTTDSTRYIQIEAASSHGGQWNNSIYRISRTGYGSTLNIVEAYTRVTGLQVISSSTADSNQNGITISGSGSTNCLIYKCIVKSGGASQGSSGIDIQSSENNVVYNCLIYDFINTSCNGIFTYGTHTYVYNCTLHNCLVGISNHASASLTTIIDCLFTGCTTACSGSAHAGTDYNATNNAAMGYTVNGSGNTHDRLSQTFTFINEGADDFHLASTDAGARDYGVSDPGSGLFSDDIDGVTRTGTWDIGADEYVAGGQGGGGLKITALDANTAPLTTDLLTIIDDPGGTPASQKITIASLMTLFCSQVVVQTFVANGTYTPTALMKKCLAICVGGGGGGAGGLNTDSAGGGGGGGATAIKLFTDADIGANKTVHVGAAGLGQTSSQAATAGGASHLGADASEIVNAGGGQPGTAGTGWASGSPLAAAGGAGGTATVGNLLIAGSPGHKGIIYSGTTGWGGEGGASSFGAGGNQGAINTAGSVGLAYGGGGGGGHASAVSDKNGANGSIGIVYIIEFLD